MKTPAPNVNIQPPKVDAKTSVNGVEVVSQTQSPKPSDSEVKIVGADNFSDKSKEIIRNSPMFRIVAGLCL